jgi:hypothetical protein
MLPRLVALKPENSQAFVPFMLFLLAFESRSCVINVCCLEYLDVYKLKHLSFISTVVLFYLPRFLR